VPLPAGLSDAAVIVYLHGFASSARSTKALYLGDRLRERGLAMRCPDFNEPDFSTLTITRMLERLAGECAESGGGKATLIGSSLGGALAILAAARWPDLVERLVLLAPAVMFAKPGHHLLSTERIEEWRRKGELPFFHYAYNAEAPLKFEFYEDSLRYSPFDAVFPQPTCIFQGRHDASVDARTVEAFAEARPNASLTLLDDDHQLTASLPRIWEGTAAFLGLQ